MAHLPGVAWQGYVFGFAVIAGKLQKHGTAAAVFHDSAPTVLISLHLCVDHYSRERIDFWLMSVCMHVLLDFVRSSSSASMVPVKVAPSFWFLNINMPIFCCCSFKIVSGRRGSNFVAVHRQNVDQIACLFLYVMPLEKAVFLKKSQNGRWAELFSPKMCWVKRVLREE